MKKHIFFIPLLFLSLVSCGSQKQSTFSALTRSGSMNLEYSTQFSVDYYQGGYSLVSIGSDRYLVVPEGKSVPEGTEGVTVIKQPVENIYVSASSAMDLFDGAGCLDLVKMTSTDADKWCLPHIAEKVENGDITYIGKYNTPDYEALVECDCGLSVASTMIYHCPEVKEKIEKLGIPVIVERSSYESHPLGRMEWIKLYGLLSGNTEQAEKFFSEKSELFKSIPTENRERKKVAFFYISSNGSFNIRKPGDYVSKMIELAGGQYVFSEENLSADQNALSTMNVQKETFYRTAKDADILIYSSSIGGNIETVEQLTDKSSILSDFKAVREGNVWCTENNVFQQTTGSADMIAEMNSIFSDNSDGENYVYFHKLY